MASAETIQQMRDDSPVCPACGAAAAPEPRETYGRFTLFACPHCDLHFWNPREMPDGHWYEQMYGHRDAKLLALEPGHKYFLSDSLAPKSGELLDAGCGTGNFLQAAREAGFEVTGTELDPGAVRFIQTQLGIPNVYSLTINDFAAENPTRKFSVVTFFEVLEHQADPVSFLRAIKSCVARGGYIALSVPNRNRWLTGPDVFDYPPNHFLRWSPGALKNFLEANGVEVVRMQEQPAGVAYAAQMFNMALRAGLSRPIAGGMEPAFRDVMQMPADEVAVLLAKKRTVRQRLFATLSRAKLAVCYVLALFAWPVVRLQQRKAAYLYCLARLRD